MILESLWQMMTSSVHTKQESGQSDDSWTRVIVSISRRQIPERNHRVHLMLIWQIFPDLILMEKTWRIVLERLCTYFSWFAIEVRLKPVLDFQNGLCGPWPSISLVQATTFILKNKAKRNSLSTKVQQNQSRSTFSQPSQLVIALSHN